MKIIIADDHKIIRDGIKSLLQQEQEFNVIAEAANGQELVELLATQPADVIVMDINMPVMDGYKATAYVKEHYPATRILALSMLDQECYVRQILAMGALGYVVKNCSREELVFALKSVGAGNPFICSELAYKLLENPENPLAKEEPVVEQEALSKCELNVLRLIAEGYTNAEIAEKLFNSKRTIESHRQNLLAKTHSKNTAALIKYALVHHLIE
ncbi:response regulator transcription factor [Adhaeribacter pallidiroseus]|uniref:Chemotaxis response regulator protein-glutamate methylesterase n=1 Tax=Adhaeribacter pallidiroseus TaxID=2072847 RepID=A0A369QJS1_9BACT|nr:response regulator transcription factor [Adhaeribacter pallidiroseus]RDC65183.1 Chemotaxis response regulator protein-glutamate methylesterase [Adhaeribacter pallidiroseus]